MTALVYPVADTSVMGGSLCNACGCRWEMDLSDEPNRQDEACEGGCLCHEWGTVESRAVEAAWRDLYPDSMAVWQAEGR